MMPKEIMHEVVYCYGLSWRMPTKKLLSQCTQCSFFRGFVSDDEKRSSMHTCSVGKGSSRHLIKVLRMKLERKYVKCGLKCTNPGRFHILRVRVSYDFKCNICGQLFSSYWRAVEHEEECRAKLLRRSTREVLLSREKAVWEKVSQCRDPVSVLRKRFVVYRLYQSGVTLSEISELLGISVYYVRMSVGDAFKYTCLHDKTCIVKPFFDKI